MNTKFKTIWFIVGLIIIVGFIWSSSLSVYSVGKFNMYNMANGLDSFLKGLLSSDQSVTEEFLSAKDVADTLSLAAGWSAITRLAGILYILATVIIYGIYALLKQSRK